MQIFFAFFVERTARFLEIGHSDKKQETN
jgi:hypothetical protein